MKPWNMLRILAILALASALPGSALAQSLKAAIVGSWSVMSVVDQYDSGQKVNNWGTVKGNLYFDAGGRFGQIIVGDAQPALKTPDPRKPDAPLVAYYGSYTVNEASKTVSFNIEAASYSARVGAPFTSTLEVKGQSITLVGSPRKDQVGTFRPVLELKRASNM
jgi:hypothetical protein